MHTFKTWKIVQFVKNFQQFQCILNPDVKRIQKYTCTSMIIAALFTISNIQKQPKYPSIDEQINKWYKYIQQDITQPKKKNKIMPFSARCMDLKGIMLSEISQ